MAMRLAVSSTAIGIRMRTSRENCFSAAGVASDDRVVELPKMTCARFRLFGAVTGIFVAISFLPSSLSGEERPHPSVVDPAITRCAVCHSSLASNHPENTASDCLSCHTFLERAGKTVVAVDTDRAFQGTEVPPPTTGPSASDTGRVGMGSVAHLEATAQRTPTRLAAETATVAESAKESRLSASPPPDGSPPSNEISVADDLYAKGMWAFNRGEIDRAIDTWSLMLADRLDHFVLQVEVDTYLVSAQSTMARYGKHSLYVLRKDDMYWVFSGLFETREAAVDALKMLPEPLRRGGAFPITVRQIRADR